MTSVDSKDGSEKGFAPVSASNPCPVCRKPDYCLVALDGTAAICPRVEAGSVKRCGDAGWLHRLTDPPPGAPAKKPPKPPKPRDWPAEAARYAKALTDANRVWLHDRLGRTQMPRAPPPSPSEDLSRALHTRDGRSPCGPNPAADR